MSLGIADGRARQGSRRLLQPVRVMQRSAKIVRQVRQVRLYPRGVLVGLQRPVMIAGIGQGVAQYLVGLGIAAPQPKRGPAGGDRLRRPAQSQQRMRVVDVKRRHRCAGADRPLDPGQRLERLAHLQQQRAHHIECFGVRRRHNQHLLVDLTCLGEAARPVQALALLKMGLDLAVRVAHGALSLLRRGTYRQR
jgi:hypothetical protein